MPLSQSATGPDTTEIEGDGAGAMGVQNIQLIEQQRNVLRYSIEFTGELDRSYLERSLTRAADHDRIDASSIRVTKVKSHVATVEVGTDGSEDPKTVSSRMLRAMQLTSQQNPSSSASTTSDRSPNASTGGNGKAKTSEQGETHYQIDFVQGESIKNLRGPEGYYTPDRLIRYAHGSTENPLKRSSNGDFTTNESLAECVQSSAIVVNSTGTARVSFTIDEGCDPVTLTLASYEKPGPVWSPENESEQEFVDADTRTFAPGGTYTLRVDLPAENLTAEVETAETTTESTPSTNEQEESTSTSTSETVQPTSEPEPTETAVVAPNPTPTMTPTPTPEPEDSSGGSVVETPDTSTDMATEAETESTTSSTSTPEASQSATTSGSEDTSTPEPASLSTNTDEPTEEPSDTPTEEPSSPDTSTPTPEPTTSTTDSIDGEDGEEQTKTDEPTEEPSTETPTLEPTKEPTTDESAEEPTTETPTPTPEPTEEPTTEEPTEEPTTEEPTTTETATPTPTPTPTATSTPTSTETSTPTPIPTETPTPTPTTTEEPEGPGAASVSFNDQSLEDALRAVAESVTLPSDSNGGFLVAYDAANFGEVDRPDDRIGTSRRLSPGTTGSVQVDLQFAEASVNERVTVVVVRDSNGNGQYDPGVDTGALDGVGQIASDSAEVSIAVGLLPDPPGEGPPGDSGDDNGSDGGTTTTTTTTTTTSDGSGGDNESGDGGGILSSEATDAAEAESAEQNASATDTTTTTEPAESTDEEGSAPENGRMKTTVTKSPT
ncbi:RNA polymerase sigma factor [Halococcus saccharolyticus DSM 5350]|uniref:RNA polymerase sigma factor n=2 Tax=Halococcus saccharolyticus TaxID=62319 RepID=M0MCP5_9EURY|nr:RNA polymerase sigma factor [Halococcus saccharolyticus DSM 5350]